MAHQDTQRINETPGQPIMPAFVPSIHYSVEYQEPSGNYNIPGSSAFPLFLSLFSFSVCWPDEGMGRNAKAEMMCPRFPEPAPLEHPIPSLKEALEKVRGVAHHAQIEICC